MFFKVRNTTIIGICLLIISIAPVSAMEIEATTSNISDTSTYNILGIDKDNIFHSVDSAEHDSIANNMNFHSNAINSMVDQGVVLIKKRWKLIVGIVIIIFSLIFEIYGTIKKNLLYNQVSVAQAEYEKIKYQNEDNLPGYTDLTEEWEQYKREVDELRGNKENKEWLKERGIWRDLKENKGVQIYLEKLNELNSKPPEVQKGTNLIKPFIISHMKDEDILRLQKYCTINAKYEPWAHNTYVPWIEKVYNPWIEKVEQKTDFIEYYPRIQEKYTKMQISSIFGMCLGGGLGIYSWLFEN